MADDAPNPSPRFRRLFTLDEANGLIRQLSPLLVTLRADREAALRIQRSLKALTPAMRGNGSGPRVAELERDLRRLALKIAAGVRQVTALGVEIKDLDHGVIDFPARRDGRFVYLCWHLGEDRIAFWHDLDSGYSGRLPL